MATLTQLSTANLALKGAGDDYNFINRFFKTKAEADAALADGSWVPVAERFNACLTGDQGLLVYNEGTSSLDLADEATRAYIDAQIGALVGDAPEVLDTLGEISDALNDNPNYFSDAAAADAANTALINAETARATAAEAAIQADVDQNEADADAAIAAVQADVDQNEADADAAIAAVQADVDQNEADADAAIAAENAAMLAAVAAVQADVDQNEADADAAIAAVQADVDQNEADADAALALKAPLESPALTGTPTAPTAAQASGTTQIATTAYVDTAVANLIDTAPGALDTLNELAAAIGDDANFSTTITNSITAVQNDVNQNEVDSDAADAALGVRIDNVEAEIDTARTNIYTALGQTEGATAMGTFTGSTLGDGQTVKQLLQTLETATETEISDRQAAIADILDGATFTGDIVFGTLARLKESGNELKIQNDAQSSSIVLGPKISLQPATGSRIELHETVRMPDGTDLTVTGAELNFVDGVTSNIQTQLDAIQADVDQNEADADAAIALKLDASAVSTFGGTLIDDADAAAARTTLGVDAAGTDNSTDVTIAAGLDYVTLSGQELTLGAVDLTTDVTGALPVANGGTGATDVAGAKAALDVDHLITLSGVAAAADDLGTFTGATINDNVTVKAALQALETAQEATQADVDQNESDADAAIAAVLAGTSIPGPYNNDADAATGGVAVGAIYKNSNGTIHWRQS